MIFDGVTIGSGVTANQLNELAWECDRVRRLCPSTASFTYLGPTGGTTSSYKNSDETKVSIAVPVPATTSACEAGLHVLFTPIPTSSVQALYLPDSALAWRVRCREAVGTVGTYQESILPTTWINNSVSDWFGTVTNSAEFVIQLGNPSYSYFCGGLVAVSQVGDWGYVGNLPCFTAFFTT